MILQLAKHQIIFLNIILFFLGSIFSGCLEEGSKLAAHSMSDVLPQSQFMASPVNLSGVWFNDGGEKIPRDDLRASQQNLSLTENLIWDGTQVKIHGAKNEVVGVALYLESALQTATNVSVQMSSLTNADGVNIASVAPVDKDGIFDWRQRPVELFLMRYLQIKGLSLLSYNNYDERHIPKKFRRPYTGEGLGSGVWSDRPDHDKYYPDVAIPMELSPTFTIASGNNQQVWMDIYIPKSAPAGYYTGDLKVYEGDHLSYNIPLTLLVRAFTLPDQPFAKTMVNLGYGDIAKRYSGVTSPNPNTNESNLTKLVRDRHFQMAHRHKISLIDANQGAEPWVSDAPRPEWLARLDGSLFTSNKGYDGPGVGVGNNVFSIGTYGSWSWRSGTEADMWTHTNNWESWFQQNAPNTERFLYLIDESLNTTQTETWAKWITENPGVGKQLKSFATLDLLSALANVPSLKISATWFTVGDTSAWNSAIQTAHQEGHSVFMYNGKRPANGSFATEDDGVALRELAWGQFKKQIDRWFFWESTYYNDYQGGRGETNVFQTAATFSGTISQDSVLGETGWNHSNGDGLLFYPGVDKVYPTESLSLPGPIASLRLKMWRRGIQDVDYLAMAQAIRPDLVQQILDNLVPKVLWEVGVADPNSPTWQRTDIGWSVRPDDWEYARDALAQIIESAI